MLKKFRKHLCKFFAQVAVRLTTVPLCLRKQMSLKNLAKNQGKLWIELMTKNALLAEFLPNTENSFSQEQEKMRQLGFIVKRPRL